MAHGALEFPLASIGQYPSTRRPSRHINDVPLHQMPLHSVFLSCPSNEMPLQYEPRMCPSSKCPSAQCPSDWPHGRQTFRTAFSSNAPTRRPTRRLQDAPPDAAAGRSAAVATVREHPPLKPRPAEAQESTASKAPTAYWLAPASSSKASLARHAERGSKGLKGFEGFKAVSSRRHDAAASRARARHVGDGVRQDGRAQQSRRGGRPWLSCQ